MNNGSKPAYPGDMAIRFGQTNDCNEGMTKREAFAMAAMQGMAANLSFQHVSDMAGGILGGATVSKAATVLADAMLAALESSP